jgi:hypothetical protein
MDDATIHRFHQGTTHTPGPWTYPGTGDFIGGGDGLRVADLYNPERTPAERIANGHLIASAPRMYAALTAIIEAGRMSDSSRAVYCARLAHAALTGTP